MPVNIKNVKTAYKFVATGTANFPETFCENWKNVDTAAKAIKTTATEIKTFLFILIFTSVNYLK